METITYDLSLDRLAFGPHESREVADIICNRIHLLDCPLQSIQAAQNNRANFHRYLQGVREPKVLCIWLHEPMGLNEQMHIQDTQAGASLRWRGRNAGYLGTQPERTREAIRCYR